MIEFDEDKRQANIIKHGLDFWVAADFEWSSAIIFEDIRFDYEETRLIAIGFIGAILVSLAYTERDNNIRAISLRLASRKERRLYDQANE